MRVLPAAFEAEICRQVVFARTLGKLCKRSHRGVAILLSSASRRVDQFHGFGLERIALWKDAEQLGRAVGNGDAQVPGVAIRRALFQRFLTARGDVEL